MLKKGFKLDEAGMKTEAVEYYIDALVRKKTNVDAKIALKKTGQNVLDDKLADFFQAQATSDHKKAVYTYLDAVKFRDRVQFVGVNLDLPESYNQMYEESKSIYINQLYSSANEDLRKENYQEAKSKLDEVQVLSPNFKDAFKLSTEAFQQPLYNRAIEAYNSGDYREAYYLFEQINSKGNFKDSRNLQEICQENGRYTVGLLAIENRTSHKAMSEAIASSLSRAILESNNPFLRVLDRSKTKIVLQEQRLNMDGTFENSESTSAGQLLGADVILSGEIIQGNLVDGNLNREQKKGFTSRAVKVKDPKTGQTKTIYEYDRVSYNIVRQNNTAACTFQYRLISTTTGEIIAADVINVERSDNLEYIDYKGDVRKLYPGTWGSRSSDDRVDQNFSSKKNIERMANAPRSIKSSSQLASEVYSVIGNEIADALINTIK